MSEVDQVLELERLRREFDEMVAAMQRPENVRGMTALLTIDTTELNRIVRYYDSSEEIQ